MKTKTEETKTEIKLADLTFDELTKLNVAQLKELCKSEGLPVSGSKKQLAKKLQTKKGGRSDRFVGGLTKCSICGQSIRVTSIRRQPLDDGRVLITRYIRCNGKHRHTYPLKEVITPD